MKKIITLFAFCVGLLAMSPVKQKRVLFFGDSITQQGVQKGGYIDLLQQWLVEENKTADYELIGKGIGGNKVYDLYLRHEKDVLAQKPDMVLIYIGINDVWHKQNGVGTDIKKYEQFYTALIEKFQAHKIEVVLCTPTVIGEKKNNANAMDADLNAYADVVRKLAKANNCNLIDLRKAFMDYLNLNNSSDSEKGILTTDRVHLNEAGNRLVANTIVETLKW